MVGDVKSESAAICSSVESVAEGLEFFLTGCVPNLQRNDGVIDGDFLFQEISPDRRFGVRWHFLLDVALEQIAALSLLT